MTNLKSFTTRDGKCTLVVGQKWTDHTGKVALIKAIIAYPTKGSDQNVVVQIDLFDHINNELKFIKESFISSGNFIGSISTQTLGVDTEKLFGLKSENIFSLEKTIAVGQIWKHYKGDLYTVTEISLNADDATDFNKAIISYRKIGETCQIIWSLPVSEWLKGVELDGNLVQRFNRVSSTEMRVKRRNIIINKSLYQYWKDIGAFVKG